MPNPRVNPAIRDLNPPKPLAKRPNPDNPLSSNCYTTNLQNQRQASTGSDYLLQNYDIGPFYDEMFAAPGVPRPHYRKVMDGLGRLAPSEYEDRRQLADLSFLLQGITFTVYSDGRGTERLFPFDLMPRVLP